MPKINVGKTGRLLWKFLFRVVFSTVLCYGGLSALFALIVYKADMDLDMIRYFAVAVDCIGSFFVAKISVRQLKNNRAAMALASVLPVMVCSVVHFCMQPVGAALFVIRLLMIPSCAVLASFSRKKIKV